MFRKKPITVNKIISYLENYYNYTMFAMQLLFMNIIIIIIIIASMIINFEINFDYQFAHAFRSRSRFEALNTSCDATATPILFE